MIMIRMEKTSINCVIKKLNTFETFLKSVLFYFSFYYNFIRLAVKYLFLTDVY